jgi:hypothetical protein
MPSSRKRPRQGKWCLGFSWHTFARCRHFRKPEDGLTIDQIMEQFDVTREQITAVLEFAASSQER